MAGSWDLFDSVSLTALSESSARNRSIDTLQIHHATMTSLSGLISLMQPGGRTVSANGAMGNDGHLVEVVRTSDRRAFTSATAFDNQCLTVECCNTTLGPEWGISHATRVRLARLAVGMYRAGILGGLNRRYIIGHSEVPGTYATACPGPDMHLDAIVALANEFYKNGDAGTASLAVAPLLIPEEINMLIIQYRTGLNVGGTSLDKSVWAISGEGGILRLTSKQWSEGGKELAALYGGLKVMSDNEFARVLDVNGISWAQMEDAFRTCKYTRVR